MTKNELLKAQREHSFLVISDGTREDLNLYRTCVTFARAWKEADLCWPRAGCTAAGSSRPGIASPGTWCASTATRRAASAWPTSPGPPSVRKFPETALLALAEGIVAQMRQAKAAGKSVMFYSAVIGSLPGQTRVAIELVTAFVNHLRSRLDKSFIINPAEHFQEGMDADDLMYMWEHVQRSGLIDVWRFQSVADIEQSFDLLHRKVPPIWAARTPPTPPAAPRRCRIALDMQRRTPRCRSSAPARTSSSAAANTAWASSATRAGLRGGRVRDADGSARPAGRRNGRPGSRPRPHASWPWPG
jgi:hypothetical protein